MATDLVSRKRPHLLVTVTTPELDAARIQRLDDWEQSLKRREIELSEQQQMLMEVEMLKDLGEKHKRDMDAKAEELSKRAEELASWQVRLDDTKKELEAQIKDAHAQLAEKSKWLDKREEELRVFDTQLTTAQASLLYYEDTTAPKKEELERKAKELEAFKAKLEADRKTLDEKEARSQNHYDRENELLAYEWTNFRRKEVDFENHRDNLILKDREYAEKLRHRERTCREDEDRLSRAEWSFREYAQRERNAIREEQQKLDRAWAEVVSARIQLDAQKPMGPPPSWMKRPEAAAYVDFDRPGDY